MEFSSPWQPVAALAALTLMLTSRDGKTTLEDPHSLLIIPPQSTFDTTRSLTNTHLRRLVKFTDSLVHDAKSLNDSRANNFPSLSSHGCSV